MLRHPVASSGGVTVTSRMPPPSEAKMSGSLRKLGAGARRLTHEAIPRLANYSNVVHMTSVGTRPTMEELHESHVEEKVLAYIPTK